MRWTKVILKEDMENLGESGDVVDVKPGYARNYLIPQGLAYEASEANVRRLEEEKQQEEERAKRDYLEARRRASQIEDASLVFLARASDEGKLFGSVTRADVADRLNDYELDFEVDRRQVELEEPIKQLGAFMVPVNLHTDVVVEVEVRVESETR
jgi:large subunit ribosomal protein L9